ncbi:MAG: hypothetical protein HC844_07650 [Tabrizicola sp.]|nr:hypothetical protein [Tabrizicola sp.]
MRTKGQIAQSAEAMDFIRYGGVNADHQVEVMMHLAINASMQAAVTKDDAP